MTFAFVDALCLEPRGSWLPESWPSLEHTPLTGGREQPVSTVAVVADWLISTTSHVRVTVRNQHIVVMYQRPTFDLFLGRSSTDVHDELRELFAATYRDPNRTSAALPAPPDASTGSSDPDDVVAAIERQLADEQWDFRTPAGIAAAIGISETQVREVLRRHPTLVRRPVAPDPDGRELYTLRTRPVSRNERRTRLRSFLTKSIR